VTSGAHATDPAAPVLELRGVGLRAGASCLLTDVHLTLRRGQTGVLLGVSGAGKSSVLRLAVGLARPDAGEVRFLGRALSSETLADARRRIGYCIQDGGLFPHLTALDNLHLMPRQLGWDARRTQERVGELCELARLSPARLARYPSQLSGGERQRVGLMRALMLDPELLLLDEPLGALDPITRAELQRDLREIFACLSKAVLLVTHDLHEAAHFADWVALLQGGRVLQQGRLADLLERPADPFVERFVGAQRDAAAGGACSRPSTSPGAA
jgi:osmoprotectant transport system ATP-binding protein